MSTAVSTQAEHRPPAVIRPGAGANSALAAGGVLVAALALAFTIARLQAPFQQYGETEKAVLVTGLVLAGVLAAFPGVYLLRIGPLARPETLSLTVLCGISLSLLAIYLFWVSWYVFFPADILIWSEGDFMNDMLKFSVGYPIYSAPVNHDSFHYVPGPQLLTYLLAWMDGKAGSLGAYRTIQVCYTALAAYMALLCCRRILRLTWPDLAVWKTWLWNGFCFASLFLIATNSITNRFTHNLHDDALAQLASTTAFYILLRYVERCCHGAVAAMVVMTTAGFLVKQSLLIWGGFYGLFLLLWGRSWKRLAVFAVAATALYGVTLAVCCAIWGQPFLYLIFGVLSRHPISPLRSFQHVLATWPYYAAMLLGGLAVLRGREGGPLFGAWLISFLLLAEETYTSGIAWMLNHIGPGSLLAGVWFLAGLASVWTAIFESPSLDRMVPWMRAAAVTASVALLFSGMGLVRVPLRPLSPDAHRYVRDIEAQFRGEPADKILLDVGTWNYVPARVIMKDRAPVMDEEGYANNGDFSGFTSRLAAKYYNKILVRGLYSSDFWYENALWPRPRGLRKAILDNYRETGKIRAADHAKDVKDGPEDPYLFGDISILEPRTN